MAWDLRAALLKKGEIESARLDDFAFRERVRTMRFLALELGRGIDPADLALRIALMDDEAILDGLLSSFPGVEKKALQEVFLRCRLAARRSLIKGIGDPTPHRLA
jgi:hypothetical protein